MSVRDDVRRWAVVIPAWRHAEDTIACLESVFDASPRPERVIVVDDASSDDSVPRLEAWAGDRGLALSVERGADLNRTDAVAAGLTIAVNPANVGFTLSSNRGLARVRDGTDAPFVLLLNNDAIVAPDFFAELAAAAGDNERAGLLTGTIYEWDRRSVWFAGGRISELRGLAFNDRREAVRSDPFETAWISGCAMLISREVLKTVGLLPVCYSPCYSEDVDYSLHARAAGFQLVLAPRAAAFHRVGVSLGSEGSERPQVTRVSNRNRAFVVRRNFRGWKRAAALGYLAVSKPPRALYEMLRGRPRTGWALLAGTFEGLLSRAART